MLVLEYLIFLSFLAHPFRLKISQLVILFYLSKGSKEFSLHLEKHIKTFFCSSGDTSKCSCGARVTLTRKEDKGQYRFISLDRNVYKDGKTFKSNCQINFMNVNVLSCILHRGYFALPFSLKLDM